MEKGLLLVTGATGLVGSTLCIAARKSGYRVRALVRSPSHTVALHQPGVEIVTGDVTDPDSLLRAVKGVQDIVHCAAVLGGTWSKATPQDFWSVNYRGVLNVLDAARQCGVRRSVCYSSTAILAASHTMSNTSPIKAIEATDTPYLRAKRAAFYNSMHRACVDQDVITVVPAGIYGPAPLGERALVMTSQSGQLLAALKGELKEYVPLRYSWVFVDDVVGVGLAALERGTNGSRYLACGRAEDVCTLPEFCNRGIEIAGLPHRVRTLDASKDAGYSSYYARLKLADPMVDPSQTAEALGVWPTPLEVGLSKTVAWLREVGQL